MTNFAAIDFETANNERSSVCSVGVVVVRGGEVCRTFYSLIRPEPEYYLYFNTRIHGLTAEDTACAPIFPQVWDRVCEMISGLPLVAHNSAFDESCLRAAFAAYSMDYPDYDFLCTCRLARSKLMSLPPQERPKDCKLGTLADFFGVGLCNHHNALADAMACAEIALRLFGK